jgi:hypothetical protein
MDAMLWLIFHEAYSLYIAKYDDENWSSSMAEKEEILEIVFD